MACAWHAGGLLCSRVRCEAVSSDVSRAACEDFPFLFSNSRPVVFYTLRRLRTNTARSRCRWTVPAAARVERCVNVTNSLMARPNGSSASATARQHGFQLPLLLKLFSNQSCGHQQLDMLSLLLGRSRPDGRLVKVFSALLVRIVCDDTSQLVVAPANRVVRMLV